MSLSRAGSRLAAVKQAAATLYAGVGMFVAARMLMYPLRPADLTPPYWVAMGATAITVLAGARIVQMADTPMVTATRGLIAGSSVVVWAFGTWLIPPLVAAGWWRHVVHRVPLRYEATLWSVTFPLGMYGVPTPAGRPATAGTPTPTIRRRAGGDARRQVSCVNSTETNRSVGQLQGGPGGRWSGTAAPLPAWKPSGASRRRGR
ncbi:hypothetical protein [Actinomadura livida]|uniref:Uncharacterized protein n=1 Tax=Actinomadura livida TaxID=79909 RepID=A0A7W7ICY3_9ACTN|nr:MULTISPECIES: hypothetical protein [Actinomadura]MBB4774807.1 hypothetical protein [Actinomadura catellatispora]